MTKNQTRRKLNQVVAFVMAAVFVLSTPLSAMATEAVKTSNYVISKVDTAKAELEKLAKSRSITAAIYLKDVYTVKSDASHYSEDVVSIASGQSVSIISVGIDEGRNIWYKIQYSYGGNTATGYIEREFLVSSDSRFLAWEDKYITTKNREAIRDNSDCSDIEAFPESYRDALYELRKTHPNWRFVRQEVGLNWNTVINEEASGERSLISGSADSSFKEKPSAGTAGWYVASKGIISYYMDPRNFLAQDTVFMFEQETFNSNTHTTATVSKVLNGTFMSGGIPDTTASYAETFVSIGSKLNMSPIALASRVKQEQGVKGTSPLISGTYAGYEGYYNYFNVKANGATNAEVYKNGLSYAKSAGWNTRVKSLEGGSAIVAKNYVQRGQDTLYLQKFDVDASDNTLYSHQYMQNISAPYSEALSTYKAYSNAGLLDTPFVFKIPVYASMPKGRCNKPNAKDVVSLNVTEVNNLPVDQNAVLISLINGGQNSDVPMTFTSSDKKIATVDDNGVITGIKPGTVNITAKRTENTTNTASCKVTVIKADIALSKVEIPSLEIVYDSEQTLAGIELPAGFEWADKTIVPQVDNEGYSVVYSPDNSKYNAITMSIPLVVNKGVVDPNKISLPKNLTIDAGAELSTVILPDGFVWKDTQQTAPKKTGSVSFTAVYCVNPACFEPVELNIAVKVICVSHEYGDWEGTHADCEKDGKLTRKCVICGSAESLVEKATGHSYSSEITKEPTVNENGVRTYICSNCGDSYTEEIAKLVAKHEHKYVESIEIEAGCLSNGIKKYTCSCNDSYAETIEALGHDYDSKHVCKRCKYELPVVPEHIHDYSLSECTATCTEDGLNIYTCGCGETYTETAVKTGHTMKNGACTKCNYGKQEAKPTEAPKPTAEVKPTEAPKPTVEAKPTETPKPTVEAKPTEAPKPTVEAKPTEAPKPTAEVKPTEEPKPTVEVKPTEAPKPTVEVKPTEEAKPTKRVEQSKPQNVVPEIEKVDEFEQGESPVAVVMMSTTVLNREKIEEYISPDNKRLEITMANDVVWDIDLTDVEDYSKIDIDLEVVFDTADIPENVIESIVQDKDYRVLELKHNGEFGCPVVMKLPVDEKYIGKRANLFYYNPDTNALEYVSECIVGEDGIASYKMKHASSYVMIYSDITMDPAILAAIDEIDDYDSDDSQNVDRGVIASGDSQNELLAGGNNIILYGIAAIAVIMIVSLTIGIVIKNRNDEDEDE